MLPAILQPDAGTLARLEAYFGLRGVRYEDAPSVPDIASAPAAKLVLLGRRWRRDTPEVRLKKVCHELLHLWGLPHDQHMRDLGYYSNPRRDRFTWDVWRDFRRGARRFEPAKFGL